MRVIKSKNKSYELMLPTSSAEITNSAIEQIVSNIKIAKHYVLIGLIMPANYIKLQGSKSKNDKTFVMPIIAKISDEDVRETGFNCFETIVIDRTDIERGSHVDGFNNAISPNAIYNYISSDNSLLREGDFNQFTEFYTISFKIVPVVAIKASYDKTKSNDIPYIKYGSNPD